MNKSEAIRQQVESFKGEADPFISTAIKNTAAALVEQAAKVQPGQNVLLLFDPPGIQLVKEMSLRCVAKGANVDYFMRDFERDAREIARLDAQGIHVYFNEEDQKMQWANKVILVRGLEKPEAMIGAPPEKQRAYAQRFAEVHRRRVEGKVDWTLLTWPTRYEAAKEGLPYEEYFRMYIEACNQPWERIHEAQGILIEQLNKGKKLEFFANENDPDPKKRTHVSMSIEGMTFVNSTIARNYPGSEVFSGPVMDSVNGQLYAEGKYEYGKLLENIRFWIKSGKIIEAHADVNNEGLQEILSRGEGARYFGEVGIGTNPGLNRRFLNPLLVEKVGGSFHMAAGYCYEYDTYGGKPVRVNNGNIGDRTPNHWDITILMHRKPDGSGGGKIVLDDEVIQNDGQFLDSRLQILNPKLT